MRQQPSKGHSFSRLDFLARCSVNRDEGGGIGSEGAVAANWASGQEMVHCLADDAGPNSSAAILFCLS